MLSSLPFFVRLSFILHYMRILNCEFPNDSFSGLICYCIPCSKIILVKLRVTELIKIIPVYYGTRRFVIVLKVHRPCFLLEANRPSHTRPRLRGTFRKTLVCTVSCLPLPLSAVRRRFFGIEILEVISICDKTSKINVSLIVIKCFPLSGS